MTWDMAAWLALAAALGIALGSIPFGVVFAKLAGRGDIRAQGSGNIGATNALRIGGAKLGVAVLAADAGKAAAAVWLADATIAHPWAAHTAALGAVLGHVFSFWLGGRGGKGVAAILGSLIALHWLSALVFVGVWMATAAATRRSSVASLCALFAVPLVAWLEDRNDIMALGCACAALSLFTHRANLARLVHGREPPLWGGSKDG